MMEAFPRAGASSKYGANQPVAASCHKTKLIPLHSAHCVPCHPALDN